MKEMLSQFYSNFNSSQGKYNFAHHLGSKIKYFPAQIGENKRVLDLGCRDGVVTKTFAAGNTLTCLDVDRQACRLCGASLEAEIIWHDLNEPLPLPNENYDVVVLSDVLEHVFLVEPLIAEIRRVLKTGGIFLGSTPNAYYWTNRLKMARGLDLAEYTDATHVHHFSLASLKKLLASSFQDVEITPYGKNVFLRSWPTLLANDFFWKAVKNDSGEKNENNLLDG
jgi:SAM-dependent methyltransferase